jgi:nitrogen fixation protein NifB
LERVTARLDNLSVVGIAGPGDPLANPVETFTTLELVRKRYPQMLLCLATNGLALPEYVDRIADLLVSHVTVTVNAVDPLVGAGIYQWIRDGKRVFRGAEGAELLLKRQLEGIKLLKARGVIVKINFILIPGVNDQSAGDVAKVVADLGADIFNCMAFIPAPGSEFGGRAAPSPAVHEAARAMAAKFLPQMRHCARCRADAVGIIGREMDLQSVNDLQECARLPLNPQDKRPYVAVASMEGVLVNQHLGRAEEFLVFTQADSGFELVESRPAPPAGAGDDRWQQMADTFKDCRAVLVNAVGSKPMDFLKTAGIEVLQMDGLIEQGLEHIYNGAALPGRRAMGSSGCGCRTSAGDESEKSCTSNGCSSGKGGCGGNGMGCL